MLMKKRLLPILVAVLMVFAIMPMNVFAADNGTSPGRSIVLGSEKISKGNTIWFGIRSGIFSGIYQQMESEWRVLNANNGTALLITQFAIDEIPYSKVKNHKQWQDSYAQTWCTSLYDRWVSAEKHYPAVAVEKSMIIPQGGTDQQIWGNYEAATLDAEKDYFYFLSTYEADAYFSNDKDRQVKDLSGNYQGWWLRSGLRNFDNVVGAVGSAGPIWYKGVTNNEFVRPAFTMDLSPVLMTSPASGGKVSGEVGADALTAVSDGYSGDWKLTLLDESRAFSAFCDSLQMTEQEEGYADWSVPVRYEGAGTDVKDYVSVILADQDDTVLYYGNIARSSASGTQDVRIPEGLKAGTYKLYVYSERKNAFCLSDCASALQEISLKVVPKTYNITEPEQINGNVQISPSAAMAGDTVTVTAEGDYGFYPDFESDGNRVSVEGPEGSVAYSNVINLGHLSGEDKGETWQFSFIMPEGGVTVTVPFTADHTHQLSFREASEAGCEEEGNIGFYQCDICKKGFSDAGGTDQLADNSWIIPASGHSPEENVTKASFDRDGLVVKKCTVCGEMLEQNTIEKAGKVSLSGSSFVYNGKARKPKVTVTTSGASVLPASAYTVTYEKNTNAGTASVKVVLKGDYYTGTKTICFRITKAANPLKINRKTAAIKYSKLKKKTQTLAVTKVIKFTKMLNDKKSYTLVSAKKGSKSFKKYYKINKTTGKVTVKKGLKKGIYKVKVKVKAVGNANYKPSSEKTVTFKVRIK